MLNLTILVLVITAAAAWAIHRDLQRAQERRTLRVLLRIDTTEFVAAMRKVARAMEDLEPAAARARRVMAQFGAALGDNMTSRDRTAAYVPRHRAGGRRG